MTNRHDEVEATGLGDEAAAWVVRLAGDDVEEADWLAFVAWLDDAPADRLHLRREAFDRAQAIWLDADHLATVARATVAQPPGRLMGAGGVGTKHRSLAWSAAAAACCAMVLAGWLVRPPRPTSAPHTALASFYETAPGEHRTLRLADGSRIDLDGGTALAIDLGAPDRRVAMARGEASFDVAHIASRPFVVDLGAAQVRVLGTAFDIVRSSDAIEVEVARGAVRFQYGGAGLDLPAGQGARLDSRGAIRLIAAPVADVGAWREGRRLYLDRPLAEVVSDLNRSYAQPLRLANARAGKLRFTGVLVLGSREVVVRRLTALLPLVARPQSDGEIVLSLRHP